MDSTIERAVDALVQSRRVLFITGAGVSADSGLPTYRGTGGLYSAEDTPEGIPIEEALSGSMLRRRPEVCWKYIAQIERACRGALPNRAHEAIVALERTLPQVVTLTQNVDGLHRRARSRQLIEMHGYIYDLKCTRCNWGTEVASYDGLALPPHCSTCRALVRPGVVLFGEALPTHAVAALERELRAGFDVVFSVGTTSAFPYIAGPVIEAAHAGIPTFEINPGVTPISALVAHRIECKAADALGAIGDEVLRRIGQA